ncbi:HAD hydrolase family protein [Micromonospora sp. NPDC007220]|uniref:HAD hydrolase family protein n=1 Tax=Micromonospora sp. NPDC007220 TaxID=3154318 RepID=UPI00340B0F63
MPDLAFAAFDLDGTLVDERGVPLPGTIEGLARLRDRGLALLLVTGRSTVLFEALGLPEHLLELFGPRLLLDNGNVEYDRATARAAYRRALPREVVPALLAAGFTELVAELDHRYVATSRRASTWFAMAHRLPRSSIEVDPQLGGGAQVGSVLVLDRVPLPEGLLGGAVEAIPFAGTAAKLLRPAGTCKTAAVTALLAEQAGEADLKRVIAFGDGRNDRCLLASAAVGVAVADSHADAAARATMRLSGPIGDFLAAFHPDTLVRRDRPDVVEDCAH